MKDELETNYLAAAIDALNKVVTSDVSPRLASKVVRFRKTLQDYAKQHNGGLQTAIDFDANAAETANEIANTAAKNAENGGAKDANGNEIADVYTV